MLPGPFGDVEQAVAVLLGPLSGGRVDDATPADLEDLESFQQVQKVGGSDDFVTDTATVDVDAYAPTRAAAWELAEAQRQLLGSGRHLVNGLLIDSVTTLQGPARRPWNNDAVHRFGGTYRVTARRPS